jgi:plasmid stability protein
MKTTLELPDELMQAVKIRAVRENRRLKDVVAELLRRGLIQEPDEAGALHRRVRLPLVQCAHPARSDEEMTPARTARVLIEQEAREAVGGHREPVR